jgi:hypothetical protein
MAYLRESGRLFELNLVDWLILLTGVVLTGGVSDPLANFRSDRELGSVEPCRECLAVCKIWRAHGAQSSNHAATDSLCSMLFWSAYFIRPALVVMPSLSIIRYLWNVTVRYVMPRR